MLVIIVMHELLVNVKKVQRDARDVIGQSCGRPGLGTVAFVNDDCIARSYRRSALDAEVTI
jgi:hypothetical protein